MRTIFSIFILLCLSCFTQSIMGQNDSLSQMSDEEWIEPLEIGPEFPGGNSARIKYFNDNAILPKNWNPDSITGKVFIVFLVDTNGAIRDPKILRGLNPILDSIALSAVKKMPNWTPGKVRDKNVQYMYNLPVEFGTTKKKNK